MPNKQNGNEKLKASELRYRRLFEASQDGILILNANSGEIEDANPYLGKLLGYPSKSFLGKELWEIGIFKDIIDSKAAFVELQNNGYIRYKDLPLKAKNGKSVEVEFISNTYMVEKQKVIQCNIRNITDRKTTEKVADETKKAMLNVMEDLESAKQVIEMEKAKDEAMFKSVGEGLIAVDNEAKIMTLNKAAEEMLGYKLKELQGKIITSLPLQNVEGNPVPLEKRPTNLAIATGKQIDVIYYFVKKDKTRLPIAINVTPIVLYGKTIGLIETIRDVAKEIEIDKAKTEFVSLASHQLRTPLGIMKWYLEALENESYFKKAPANLKNYFNVIYRSNERVLSLVRDLLSVSRIDQRKIKNDPKPVNIVDATKAVMEEMQIVAKNKKIILSLNIKSKDKPIINIDALRFHEVIQNLIGNAIEYTITPKPINIVFNEENNIIFITVKDLGIGISLNDQKKLFTKFFRSEKAIKHNPEGSGLGLYVVKSYVEEWGGKITVESTEGKGSTFTISLPRRVVIKK